MQFKLSYLEVQSLISSKTGKDLPMCFGGPHSVRISYKVPLMGSVGLDLTVDRIDGSDLYVSFGGGAGIEFMMRTALNQAKNQSGMEMIEMLGGNQLLVSLGKNPQTSSLFERITLQDIHFDEASVMIDFIPKI